MPLGLNFPRDPGPEHEQLASDLRFKVQDTLEILGVRACFAGDWRLLHCRVRKAVLRANLLGWATRNHKFRRQLFLSLVVPPFAWAAGFARPGAEDVQTLRHAIEDAFKQTFSPTFARVCLFESVGWGRCTLSSLVTSGLLECCGKLAFRPHGGWRQFPSTERLPGGRP